VTGNITEENEKQEIPHSLNISKIQ